MSIDIEKEKANQFRFLKLFYEKCGADEERECEEEKLGVELGFDKETTDRISRYLHAEGLLCYTGIGGPTAITHKGIVEMQQASSKPNQSTQHFPASTNIVQVMGDVIDSPIQQATQASQQILVDPNLQRALSDFLVELDKKKGGLKLDEDKQRDLGAEVETIRAQLKSSKPKHSIIKEALSAVRSILESAGATLLAAELAKLLAALA